MGFTVATPRRPIFATVSSSLRWACLLLTLPALAQTTHLASPNKTIEATITASPQDGITYNLQWNGKPFATPAHIGLRTQQHDLGAHTTSAKPIFSEIDEHYPFLGAKSIATNHAHTVSIPMTESDGTRFTLEARAYDDGFAFRIVTTTPAHILAETSTVTLPAGTVWFGERNNAWKLKSYAGEFHSVVVDALPTISSQGPIQAPPLVVEMPHDTGFALYTEAALTDFSGMRLRTLGNRTLAVDFTEGTTGFTTTGPAITPWRVVLLCPDLNGIVNNTITENLNPAPAPKLFADVSYIRPGRSVWRFMSRNTGTPEQERQFVDYAAALGYEYSLVDEGWLLWAAPWPSLTELATYARTKHVGIFAWKNTSELRNPANDYADLRDFFDHAKAAGLAGVKIDFINGESKAQIDFERRALTLAAERRLMVDFHGIQKPTGEERAFPNGLTREGVRGIELNHMAEGPIPASHNAALPFTRMAVGPGDYTPFLLTWPGETTWTHQLATAVLLSAPILCIAEDPEFLLKNPDTAAVLPIVRALPAVWDETIVLPGSHIGELAAMARRSGKLWFIAAINGGPKVATLPHLPPAIDLTHYKATVVTSPAKRAFATKSYPNAAQWMQQASMPHGDGVVVLLEPIRP